MGQDRFLSDSKPTHVSLHVNPSGAVSPGGARPFHQVPSPPAYDYRFSSYILSSAYPSN